MYSYPNLDDATDAVARASAARPFVCVTDREIVSYEVRAHGWDEGGAPVAWGVWPAWVYSDKPDVRGFGGPFVPVAEIPTWKHIEEQRREDFRADSMLEDFVSTALQDAQLTEDDAACSEEREARDSGTVYTLNRWAFDSLREIVSRFRRECGEHIAAALELEPGEPGLQWRTSGSRAGQQITDDELGSTLWLAVTGSGVTFTDDGDAPCLEAMADWASHNRIESLYFGDNGSLYLA